MNMEIPRGAHRDPRRAKLALRVAKVRGPALCEILCPPLTGGTLPLRAEEQVPGGRTSAGDGGSAGAGPDVVQHCGVFCG